MALISANLLFRPASTIQIGKLKIRRSSFAAESSFYRNKDYIGIRALKLNFSSVHPETRERVAEFPHYVKYSLFYSKYSENLFAKSKVNNERQRESTEVAGSPTAAVIIVNYEK